MIAVVVASAVAVTVMLIAGKRARTTRPAPLRNDLVAGLAAEGRQRIVAQVGDLARTAEVALAEPPMWTRTGDNLLMTDGIEIGPDDLIAAGVDFAATRARGHDGAPTETHVTAWLKEGISKAIGRMALCGMKRMEARMALATRNPPPSPEERAALLRENARDRAAIDAIFGPATDASALPSARLRRR